MIRVGFVIGGYPPEEHKRRADVALSYSTQEIQVGIVDVAASPYFYGMTPAEIQLVGAGIYRKLQTRGERRLRCRGSPRHLGFGSRRRKVCRRYSGHRSDGSRL